jgi:preprotein translocase subunit YajC
MMDYLRRIRKKYQREGLAALIKAIYQFIIRSLQHSHPKEIYSSHIRPRTSISTQRTLQMSGLTVHPYRSLDSYFRYDIPIERPDEIEAGAVEAIQSYVKEGDEVIVIGGGWGITTTIAAKVIGENGYVTVYEGASNMVDQVHDTVNSNNVSERVDIHHGIVANAYNLTGYAGGAKEIPPGELGSCDVLEMDCEGAETDIIPELSIRPEFIMVENLLKGLDYDIISKSPAETRVSEEYVRKNDLYTVVARHKK